MKRYILTEFTMLLGSAIFQGIISGFQFSIIHFQNDADIAFIQFLPVVSDPGNVLPLLIAIPYQRWQQAQRGSAC